MKCFLLLFLSFVLLQKGYAQSVEEIMESVDYQLSAHPEDPAGWLARASYYQNYRQNYSAAITDYTEAIRLRFSKHKSWGRSSKEFRQIAKEGGVNLDVQVYLMRGYCYFLLKDFSSALTDYNNAGKLAPGLLDVLAYRAPCYLCLKRYPESIADYTRLIATRTGGPDVEDFLARGKAYSGNKETEKAIADFRSALQIDPKHEGALVCLGNHYGYMGKLDSAVSVLSRAVRYAPNAVSPLISRGAIYAALKKDQLAQADFTGALSIDSSSADTYNRRAASYYASGNYKAAMNDWGKAYRQSPDSLVFLYDQVILQVHLNDFKGAAVAYRKLQGSVFQKRLEVSPMRKYVEACINYFPQRQYDLLIPILKECLASFEPPKESVTAEQSSPAVYVAYASVLTKLGMIYEQKKSYKVGASYYRQAAAIDPRNNYNQNQLRFCLGRLEQERKNDVNGPVIDPLQYTLSSDPEGSITISGSASDVSGIQKFTINGFEITAFDEQRETFQVTVPFNGWPIQIIATDKKGNATSKRLTADMMQAVSRSSGHAEYYAVLIACSRYGGNDDLENTITDAEHLKKVLVAKYGFREKNVIIIPDHNKSDILKMTHQAFSRAGDRDNILLMFSGHGKLRETPPFEGGWVPVNALGDWDLISPANIRDMIWQSLARHVLVLSDACFSGDMAEHMVKTGRPDSKSGEVMTSGASERVPAASVFMTEIIRALENNQEHILPAYRLYSQIAPLVSAKARDPKTGQPNKPLFLKFNEQDNKGGYFYFTKQ